MEGSEIQIVGCLREYVLGEKRYVYARDRRFDFSPIILLQPKLVRTPSIDRSGRLRLTGYFETVPEKLNFDLLFEPVAGRWRLFGIAANTTSVPTSTTSSADR